MEKSTSLRKHEGGDTVGKEREHRTTLQLVDHQIQIPKILCSNNASSFHTPIFPTD